MEQLLLCTQASFHGRGALHSTKMSADPWNGGRAWLAIAGEGTASIWLISNSRFLKQRIFTLAYIPFTFVSLLSP